MKIIALVLFAFVTTDVFGTDTIGRQYDLSKAVALIAVDKDSEGAHFSPLRTKFEEPNEVSKLCEAIDGSIAVKAGQGPFVGHLCHFVLVDGEGEILAMVSILNYNCLFDIHGAHRNAEGKIVADYGKKAFGFTSRDVARSFYDGLKKNDQSYMKKMEARYARVGKTVEGLLFGNQNDEKDGGGQPATRPGSK